MNGYVYPTDSLSGFSEHNYPLVLLGHTHYPMDKTLNAARIINPGSCGQPRDYRQPCCAILDFKRKKLKFIRVKYDPNLLIKEIINNKEKNKYLIEAIKIMKG